MGLDGPFDKAQGVKEARLTAQVAGPVNYSHVTVIPLQNQQTCRFFAPLHSTIARMKSFQLSPNPS